MTDEAVATPEAPPAVPGSQVGLNFDALREKDPKEKIPELEISWDDAEALELADDSITELIALKRQYRTLHIVPTDLDLYVFKSCSRLAWRKVISETMSMEKSKQQHLDETGGDEDAAAAILSMMQEERLVHKFLVKPQKELAEIRELPPGEVKTLYDSLTRALGYNQPIRAIRI